MTVNAIKTVFGDAHIDIDKSNVVYSRKNGEGLRTLLGEPNSPEYSETPHVGNSIAQNGDGVNRDGKPVDHSGDWTPVEGKDGVWHTAEYPEVEIDLQDVPAAESGKAPVRTMFIDNLPDLATLDEAGQMKLGKFLVEQRTKAEKAGVEEINLGKTPEEAAKYQELADRYEQKVNARSFRYGPRASWRS